MSEAWLHDKTAKRRRYIPAWTEQLQARKDYECEQCGGRISALSLYERRVFALPSRLEIETVHSQPSC